MKNWNACWILSSLSNLVLLLLLTVTILPAQPASHSLHGDPDIQRLLKPGYVSPVTLDYVKSGDVFLEEDTSRVVARDLPKPGDVLLKSVFIPGWGQVVNRQVWKVPLIYGMLGGLTWYNIYLTKKYHDYRAAFFNANNDEINPDFGPTPDYIPEDTNPNQLKSSRDRFRNRRDFMYIVIGLAYGLNALDAYIFAHLRSFDVSKDLSLKTTVRPSVLDKASPGVTLSVELFKRKK